MHSPARCRTSSAVHCCSLGASSFSTSCWYHSEQSAGASHNTNAGQRRTAGQPQQHSDGNLQLIFSTRIVVGMCLMMSARAKCRPRSGWWWHTVNHTKDTAATVLQVLTGEVQLHNTAQVSLHQWPNMVFQAPDFPWFRPGYTGERNC